MICGGSFKIHQFDELNQGLSHSPSLILFETLDICAELSSYGNINKLFASFYFEDIYIFVCVYGFLVYQLKSLTFAYNKLNGENFPYKPIKLL